MNTTELIAAVRQFDEVEDFTDAQILELLNRGLLEIAGGGDRQHGNAKLAPLPDLFTQTTLDVTTISTTMPATFHRSLARVTDSSSEKLKRYDGLIKFLDVYEGEADGAPEAYCLKGNTLWVSPISSTTLNVYYHQLPTVLVNTTNSSPTCLPSELHFRLLVNYACKEIFRVLETSVDLGRSDEQKHSIEYQKALTDLERLIGSEDGEAMNIDDDYYSSSNII